MKDSGIEWIGEIPEHWRKTRQGYEAEFINGYAYSEREFTDSGYPIIRIQNLNGGNTFLYSDLKLPKKQFTQNGDLLFAWSATFGPFIWKGPNASYHYHQWKVVPKKNLDKKFMYYNLDKISDVVKSMSHSGIDMVHMTKLSMEKLPIFLPGINEQQQISNYLDKKIEKIDKDISENKKLIELLKEKRQSVINHAVTKGLDDSVQMKDSGIEWIGEIPEHWDITKIKMISDVRGRIGWKGYTVNDLRDDGALVIGATNILNSKLDLSKLTFLSWEKYYESPEIMLNDGDLLLVQRGSTVGKVVMIDKHIGPATINPSMILLTNLKINNSFFWYQLQSNVIQFIVNQFTTSTAIPMITQNQLSNFSIVMPSKIEQKTIEDYLDEDTMKIGSLMSKVELQIKQLQEFKKSLISSAVTGKIQVVQT
jgi:type I restriction enzyme, S subunit